ncbi:hypothetical protein D3H65_03455 [Paraflavitalea soli]|uniref:DUF4468 domain-containing protein n=1 Tax=Paraflavitalea soli TaxID=2315862 RepID=A0A3B7MIF1_9BACT|nr:hypothetical protein [Paraflavitalea soli]AXY73083.1 hypothetical protein D3H65_03455 [Paraflavitalea soli]
MHFTKHLLLLFLLILTVTMATSQQKVAVYAIGKPGIEEYERFAFWTKDGKRERIDYAYGKEGKEVKIQYIRKDLFKGDSCFVVRFVNNYQLYVIPQGLTLKVIDGTGKYEKLFSWEYEGPVNGIGTFCTVCAEDEMDAMKIIKASYLK